MSRSDMTPRTTIGGASSTAWRCFACGRKLAYVQLDDCEPPSDPQPGGRVEIACPRCGRTSAFALSTGAPIGPTRRSHSATRRRRRGAEPPEGPAVSNLENKHAFHDPEGVREEDRCLDA